MARHMVTIDLSCVLGRRREETARRPGYRERSRLRRPRAGDSYRGHLAGAVLAGSAIEDRVSEALVTIQLGVHRGNHFVKSIGGANTMRT